MLYRLFRKHLRRHISFHRYHKQWSIIAVAFVVLSTLSAIEHQEDGSWSLPFVLFYVSVYVFIVGSLELILLCFNHYKLKESKYKAISRAISCYGFAVTSVTMCELYDYVVHF